MKTRRERIRKMKDIEKSENKDEKKKRRGNN